MKKDKEPGSLGVLLRLPVFRRLWLAISISSLGDWLGLLATTALAAYLTREASGLAQGAAISGVLLTRLMPDLLLGPIAGALVDKLDRRMVAAIGDTIAGLLYLSIALTGTLTWLLIAQFLVEAVGLFTNPAKQAMWVNIVPRERLAVANQLNYVSVYGMVPVAAALFAVLSTVAQFFGAPPVPAAEGSTALIAGSTSATAINIALVIDALTYFFAAGTVALSRKLIPAFVGERSVSKSIFSLIVEGISYVKNSRLMRAIYLGILGAFGAGGLTAGVAQAYVASLGAGNAGYGILFGTVFTGLAIGMLIGPKVLPTVPRRLIFTFCIGAAGTVLVVMALVQDFVGAVITSAVMGLFAGIAWITGFTMIGHEVTDQLRGRVFAFVMSSVRLMLLATIAAGPVLAGAAGSHLLHLGGFRFQLSAPGIVLACGGVVALLVSLYAARQVGSQDGGGLLRRLLGRRRRLLGPAEHPGALLVVEGADPVAVGECLSAVADHLGQESWSVATLGRLLPPGDDPAGSHASALRAGAALSELVADRIQPELDEGSVVLCAGYVDTLVVRFGVVGGLGDDAVLRLAHWAVDGLQPDLTILVDAGRGAPPDPDEEPVPEQVTHAYRDRASSAPERYLEIAPLAGHPLTAELLERVDSVLRSRSPVRAVGPDAEQPGGEPAPDPQRAATPERILDAGEQSAPSATL